eukprot:scaffold82310_cov30-Tisochrysis_lutea.AAC.3
MPESAIVLDYNGERLADPSATPHQLGLANGATFNAMLVDGEQLRTPPTGLPFLDVTDSELSALADMLSVTS